MKKITKLSNLDTKGVAVVTRGANNKRIALSKGAENTVTDVTATIEKLFLQVIEKGDMPIDEKTIDDACKAAGLDPQMAETVKAIMKLRYVYRDNAAFQTVVEQMLLGADEQGAGDPNAPQGQDGDAPEGQGANGPDVYDANAKPADGGAVAAQQQNGGPTPGAATAPNKQPAPGKPAQMAPGEEKPKQAVPGSDASQGSTEQQAGDGKAPPFGKDKQQAAPGEGAPKKEPFMTEQKKEEDTKKAAEAVSKAAEMEAVIKSQEATIKAQTEALASNTAAVKKMQDDLRLQAWVTKADKDLKYISGSTPEELGKQLFDIDSVNAELATKNFEMLKAQSVAMKANAMFKPSGVSGGAPVAAGSAEEEITKRAEEIVKKGLNGMKREHALAVARTEIIKADPALYNRYLEENPVQTSRGQ